MVANLWQVRRRSAGPFGRSCLGARDVRIKPAGLTPFDQAAHRSGRRTHAGLCGGTRHLEGLPPSGAPPVSCRRFFGDVACMDHRRSSFAVHCAVHRRYFSCELVYWGARSSYHLDWERGSVQYMRAFASERRCSCIEFAGRGIAALSYSDDGTSGCFVSRRWIAGGEISRAATALGCATGCSHTFTRGSPRLARTYSRIDSLGTNHH